MRGEEIASGKRELRDYLASQRVHARHRRSRRFYCTFCIYTQTFFLHKMRLIETSLQIEDVFLFICCILISYFVGLFFGRLHKYKIFAYS